MPRALANYVRYIGWFNTRVGKIMEYGIFVIIAIMLIEAVRRYFFNNPTVWSIELGKFVLGTYFIIGAGYILLCEGHVRMDALSSRWSAKRRTNFELATFFTVIVYLTVLLRGSIDSALFSLRLSQHSATPWGPPLSPIKVIIVIGVSLLLLQAIALFIRDLSIVKGKPIQ